MDRSIVMILAMSLVYLIAFFGLVLAWRYFNKSKKKRTEKD
ncbi:MAG: hypothetical protein PVH88_07315 [Ignavibacteria bacterium]|jgi:hypothetical protein